MAVPTLSRNDPPHCCDQGCEGAGAAGSQGVCAGMQRAALQLIPENSTRAGWVTWHVCGPENGGQQVGPAEDSLSLPGSWSWDTSVLPSDRAHTTSSWCSAPSDPDWSLYR